LRTVFDQAKALTSLGGKPLGVVSADVGTQAGWVAAQAKLAAVNEQRPSDTARLHACRLARRSAFRIGTSRSIPDVVRAARSGRH